MDIKYFYYISKTKVDMLEAQVRPRRIKLPGISPKVEIAGLSLSADIKSQENNNLVQRLISLIASMRKKDVLKSLDDCTVINTSIFYHDQSKWRSGLFSFRGRSSAESPGTRLVSYFTWKPWYNSIIILTGSPINILEEKVVEEGVFCLGSTSGWGTILNFVERTFRADEVSYIRNGPIPLPHHNLDYIPILEKGITVNDEQASRFDFHSKWWDVDATALELGLFCITHLIRLPQYKIDTAFKVFRRLDFKRRVDLPIWIEVLNKIPRDSGWEKSDLEKCHSIFIGSPLYTALV